MAYMADHKMNKELSSNEIKIIEFLRQANPYEKIIITKDSQGKLDNYIIQREQKVFLTTLIIKPNVN